MRRIRTYHEVREIASDLGEQVAAQHARVEERLSRVGRVVVVMSGKGGVGKSLISACLAAAWTTEGHAVGLLDADLTGPSAAGLLGMGGAPLRVGRGGIDPACTPGGIRLMSMGLLLPSERALRWHEPAGPSFVWRGAQERGAFREFLSDVNWGTLHTLVVDLPPGTSRLAELQDLVPGLAGCLAVTIPSAVSRDSVARSLDLAHARDLPILGIVENHSGYRCAQCRAIGPLHPGSAGAELSERFGIPLLARLPFDPDLSRAAELGEVEAWVRESRGIAADVRTLARRLSDAGIEVAG